MGKVEEEAKEDHAEDKQQPNQDFTPQEHKHAHQLQNLTFAIDKITEHVKVQTNFLKKPVNKQLNITEKLNNETRDISSRVTTLENSTSFINIQTSNIVRRIASEERSTLSVINQISALRTSLSAQGTLTNRLNTQVNTISNKKTVLGNKIQSLDNKLQFFQDTDAFRAFKRCTWQSGEGTENGSYSNDVNAGSPVTKNECIKLCIKKSAGYNGAIYHISSKGCSCLSNMNGRDSDGSYVSCYIR
ncbi:uncharacterized protein LOC130657752 [Hydractinia symbiolongicarpus]|uniref:uncharacterized protein LOC130657752 n=1 Tax=Hydractinia symbiolongicarpus TaxID=13093 RepID=UPI002550AE9B|nr:uncharacterized protein LOC130657752 [Hydractinia symbiolongicarpus]